MKSLRLLMPLLLVLCSASQLSAQYEQSNLISGTGTVSLKRMPETMRLQVAILGRGSTLKDALAALKTRTAKAQTQLVSLGAEKESIKVGDARVTEMQNDRNRAMQMMMMQRAQRGGKAAQKAAAEPPVLVTAQLTAEWKLSSKTSEELLLAVHPIQEKVKAADLAGSKEAEKLTPEQEEMLEEAEQSYGYSSNNEQKPGEPVFLFVSKISDTDREQAMADAYVKAKAQASRLAKAAGASLGGLKSVNSYGGLGGDEEDFSSQMQYGSYAYRAMQMARQRQGASTDEAVEALGVESGTVKFNVSITASFSLEPAK